MDLLVIEDNPLAGDAMRAGFLHAGHQCRWERDGQRGLELATTERFDAVLLEMVLPERTGLEIMRALRGAGFQTPLIVVTSLTSIADRVAGLGAGADDYVVKPFAWAELMARVEAVCRRSAARAPAVVQTGNLTLDLAARRVTRAGQKVELTPTEFSIVEYLMRYAPSVVTRRMLCEHLWDNAWEGATNVIEVHINRIRRKLDKGFENSVIQTVRGRGYALRAG
jgi:two-component system OmpR family response regulator/two-component system copper resistance phosphate regulon response regulator CusR